jgi:hypothetical protein
MGGTAGTYTVDCGTPATIGCLYGDQVLSVSNVVSGSYRIHVRGAVGTTDCYVNDDTFAVPAQGMTLTRTLNLAKTTGTCM